MKLLPFIPGGGVGSGSFGSGGGVSYRLPLSSMSTYPVPSAGTSKLKSGSCGVGERALAAGSSGGAGWWSGL